MAYSAEGPDVLVRSQVLCRRNLADDGLQEVDLVARTLLGDKALHAHLFVADAGITWTIRG
jgi:hypothetical protein